MSTSIRLIFVYTLFFSLSIRACDICGCKLGGLTLGLLSGNQSHYLGFRLTHASFEARIRYQSAFLADEFSEDTFLTSELIGRYVLSEFIQFHALIPYAYNRMKGNTQRLTFSGIGDPTVLVFFSLLRNSVKRENFIFNAKEGFTIKNKFSSHLLLVGGGVKLPVGDFDRLDQGTIVNRNFQLGTGSMAYLLSANYTWSHSAWGMQAEVSYTIHTKNPTGYLFGNQLNANLNLFFSLPFRSGAWTPFAGLVYENSKAHEAQRIRQFNTGGYTTFLTLGTQLNIKKISLMMTYQNPIDQKYNADSISEIKSNSRISIGILYQIALKTKKMML